MKPILFITLLCCWGFVFAQKQDLSIYLKAGKLSAEPNITSATVERINQRAARFNNTLFALIQFETLPGVETRKQLSARGIILLDYIPKNTFSVTIKGKLDLAVLKKAGARTIIEPEPQYKMFPALAAESLRPGIKGYKEVWVSFPGTFNADEVTSQLRSMNFEIISDELRAYRILGIKVPVMRLSELAGLPYIEYIQPSPPADKPLNLTNRTISGANVLNTSVARNGKGLNGEGIVIGIGDNANVLSHVDLTGRIIDHTVAGNEVHGMHVTGIAGGAGIINESNRGYASKAKIVSQTFSNIIYNAPAYVRQFGMVVTNNSYGNNLDCSYSGSYDMNARILDQQAFEYPGLQHVFAAGNSGAITCAPFPPGFKTVLGGYQSAKNIIAVGNIDANEIINSGSSKGPVLDGRIKPEITALGTSVISTFPNNRYAASGGTSMAAPAVSGGLALLYQRYRQLHGNTDPKSGLMKALLCNGASDRGNSGPDYTYGFGSMDLLRSVDMLEQNRFIDDSIANLGEKQYTISIPENTARLKVMLYWHDPAATSLSAKTLVHDLDVQLITPGGQTLFPMILDTAATGITNPATTGADHINNIEQVSIDNPQQGSYTIRVLGTEIAQNPFQEFFVVYDIIPNSIKVTYPAGGEGLAPGENARIAWEAFGDTSTTYSLDYSTDNGITWTSIGAAINKGTRFHLWKVPATVTEKAMIRVIKDGTGQSSTSGAFSIIGVPVVSLSAVQCEGYININWSAIAHATDYEVMMLKGDEMTSVAYTTGTTYTLNSLSKDSTYWVSVRARINGSAGRRALAISRKPDNGTCAGSISDNDLALQSILSPSSGRKFTSSELSNETPVKVQIKNLDNVSINDFAVKYSVDGGNTWVTENVMDTIGAGKVLTYTFSTKADLAATGSYQVIAVVQASKKDNNVQNDTLIKNIVHLDNQPIDLASPFTDDLETAQPGTYISGAMGLKGLDRYDLVASTPYGRLRTSFDPRIAASGTKAINLDAYRMVSATNVNSLIGTYNLSAYDVKKDELRLNFQAFSHGQDQYANNKVWVRENDTAQWIEIYNMNTRANDFYNKFGLAINIEFGDSLLRHGQNVSSSFQIKWGQEGRSATISEIGNDGYTFDDISIYKAVDDVQLISIDAPSSVHCGRNTALPLKITLHNSTKNAIANVPVKYSINSGNWVTETIASLPGDTTITYTFLNGIDFPGTGTFNVKVIADAPTDNYRLNDTATITVQNLPLVTSYPYLENFEQGSSGWYADGVNNSWAFGKPASSQINSAASGVKAWKTNLTGTYNDEELSYLYSPCFNLSGLKNPTLSFSVALDIENCGTSFCDAAWVDYSVDGEIWYRLMDTTSFNWYDKGFYWATENDTRWHVATTPLPGSLNNIRIRFGFYSDGGVSREGIAIDDIHIYDWVTGIYDGGTLSAPITQMVNGDPAWVHFNSDGKLVASLQANQQHLGNTLVNVYINKDSVRYYNNQFYHDRSFTVNALKPDLKDSVTFRLYFLDSEIDALVNASGCSCSKPASAYELGVSGYDDSTLYENGTIEDNKRGIWAFYPPGKVAIVPFDKGYYAEFKVKDLSEFWLSDGGIGGNSVLPVKLMNVIVRKESQSDANIIWTVESESQVDHYEIEIARGTENLHQGNFEKIGVVMSRGNTSQQQQYSFKDEEYPKSGIRYYRLKVVDINGTVTYSNIRSLTFPNMEEWILYPNPSQDGKFYFIYEINRGEEATLQITDVIGRLVKTYNVRGNGYAEKMVVDISAGIYAKGVYMLTFTSKEKGKVFKLYKQ